MPENYEDLKQSVYATMGIAAEAVINLLDEVYASGYDEGRDAGYNNGYDDGYDAGEADASAERSDA